MCFGGPSFAPPAPLPAAAAPPPTQVDPAVLSARDTNRARAAAAAGRGSTILTNPLGLSSNSSGAKTLLGI